MQSHVAVLTKKYAPVACNFHSVRSKESTQISKQGHAKARNYIVSFPSKHDGARHWYSDGTTLVLVAYHPHLYPLSHSLCKYLYKSVLMRSPRTTRAAQQKDRGQILCLQCAQPLLF